MERSYELDVLPQRVVFGVGRVGDVPAELQSLHVSRVLVVATRSAKPVADALAERLGTAVVGRIHEVAQHVPADDAGTAVGLATASNADGVVAIGGGSAIGLGKAVAVETGLPLTAVPTTYSGSEVTPIFGVTGEHKRTGRDPRALPRLVVYDPALTTSMPRQVTATSGLNAIAHCVEALYSPGVDPVTTLLAEEGVRLLAEALPVAVETPSDVAARSTALHGAYLGGRSLASAGTALHHTLCHVIGGTYRLPHGDLHAVLLPYVTAYNAGAAPQAVHRVATALGTTDAAVGLRRLAESLGAPTSLTTLGLSQQVLDDVVDRTIAAIGDRNPRPVDARSLSRMLDDAYSGSPPTSY